MDADVPALLGVKDTEPERNPLVLAASFTAPGLDEFDSSLSITRHRNNAFAATARFLASARQFTANIKTILRYGRFLPRVIPAYTFKLG